MGQTVVGGLPHLVNAVVQPTLIDHFRDWAAEKLVIGSPGARELIPAAIYMRGSYCCLHHRSMSDAFVALDVEMLGDGAGLLSFVALLYKGLNLPPYNGPWWLQNWDAWNIRFGIEAGEPGGQVIGWRRPAATPTAVAPVEVPARLAVPEPEPGQ